jgi:hypothetical protein
MNDSDSILKLKEHLSIIKINHEEQILTCSSLKDAHIYCILYKVSAQQYGPLLEKFIISKFNYTKNKSSSSTGDFSKNSQNIELKASLGGSTHKKFNFVQIRTSHSIDFYLLTAYYLTLQNVDNKGELYILHITKESIKNIIISHGKYAHGTKKRHGPITIDSIEDETNQKEYALRPSFNDKCWKDLLPFRISESDL